MEPYWNFGRMNQVFGRAIRFKSHKDLPENKRNVEQYLYVSFLPEGKTVETIYKSLKDNQDLWPEVRDIDIKNDVKDTLSKNYPQVLDTITKIISIKDETEDRTIDQMMFDIMERKNKISTIITDIIKESSVDCIQNTRDNFDLNQRCLRFSEILQDEITLFPGVTAETLNNIDVKQIKNAYLEKISKNLYVLSALQEGNELYIYYEIDESKDKPDIRYIRENGKRICDVNLTSRKIFFYEDKTHTMNKELGAKFSIYQTIYNINSDLYDKIMNEGGEIKIFPPIDGLVNEEFIHGYSVRYNVNERLFYRFFSDKIVRLYDYKLIEQNRFEREIEFPSLIIYKGKFYSSN